MMRMLEAKCPPYESYFDSTIIKLTKDCFTAQQAADILSSCSIHLHNLHRERKDEGKIAIKQDRRAQFHASFLASYVSRRYGSEPGATTFALAIARHVGEDLPSSLATKNTSSGDNSGVNTSSTSTSTSTTSKRSAGYSKFEARSCTLGGSLMLKYYLEAVGKLPQCKLIMTFYDQYLLKCPMQSLVDAQMKEMRFPEEAAMIYAHIAALGRCIALAAGNEVNEKIRRDGDQHVRNTINRHNQQVMDLEEQAESSTSR